jgi:hypothetical protein
MGAAAVQEKNRLSDGRLVRALEGTYTQIQMFRLKGRIPTSEGIMSVKELDDAINLSGAHSSINVTGWWRTNRYAVYAKGFEKELDKPVGAKVVWIENGVSYTFEVPDVKNPMNKDKGLRQASGMLDFALDKLQYDEEKRIVSVTPDFTETDVTVRDIMRPRNWALVDADGYPIRTRPSDQTTPDVRYSYVRHSGEFDKKASGYHGSVARDGFSGRRFVYSGIGWQGGSGVAVVGRDAIVAGNIAPIVRKAEQSGCGARLDRVQGAPEAELPPVPKKIPVAESVISHNEPTKESLNFDDNLILNITVDDFKKRVADAEDELIRLSKILHPDQLAAFRWLIDGLK